MNFPSFGDAAAYDELGRACAAALTGRGGAVFEACYHPLRPPGAALLMALPYLVTGDPVDATYMALALNLLFFALCVVALAAVLMRDAALLAGWPRRNIALGALVFFVLLLNLIAHIPVRLADMPAMALFLCAAAVGADVLARAPADPRQHRRYAVAGLLSALSVLLKISQAPFSLLLLAVLLAFDGRARGRERLRRAAAFLAGFALMALQVLNVWAHTGRPWLYDADFIQRYFSHAPHRPSIEAVVYTIPTPNAYMVRVTEPISYPTFLAVKLYRGVFGFEWAVYMGEPSRGPWWTPGAGELALAWAVVLAYLAFSAWCVWRGPPSLRLLNALGAPTAVMTAILMHTELRYYALPRSVMWVSLAAAGLSALRRLRARVPRGAQ